MNYDSLIAEWMEKSSKMRFAERLWAKDPSLWKKNSAEQSEIRSRLGWLDAPGAMRPVVPDLLQFAQSIRQEGFTHVMLLGMGGSSLAPEVFQNIFGGREGFPTLLILDSTDPGWILELEGRVSLEKCLFIVSSKSGGTIELQSLYKYFFEKIKALRADPGKQFVAITDPGTVLARLAQEGGFRKTFLAPADVGGRFSALTVFGLLPAALIGVDIEKILAGASQVDKEAAVKLGVAMAVLAEEGRDKLTLLLPKNHESFGDWVEQLVAESTGKEGMGIVPVVREELGSPEEYGQDRFFVSYLPKSQTAALKKADHPIFNLAWDDDHGLGMEFFRWEIATAAASALLKINAFDQPDVQSAKDRTGALLKRVEAGERLEIPKPERSLEAFWEEAEEGDYVALLAFLPGNESVQKKLSQLALAIRKKTKNAVTVGVGPRYLHSTGQLHKGGPNKALFLLITTEPSADLPVPGEKYTFAQLELAQALGDLEALESKGRWLYSLRIKNISDLTPEAVI
ncbi:MAG: glucose-6-phosphate isomerase [Candidatus Omnitrophica bacterium]|nr:glucose-6-phosphate isomerase [Candidatus Omnitrophota bacterium]